MWWIYLVVVVAFVSVVSIVRYLYKRSWANSAKDFLWILREGVCNQDCVLECIHERLKKSGYSLSDIGTSEGELLQLKINCFKHWAVNLLEQLRRGYANADIETDKILLKLRALGLRLADIGTDEEEIKQIRIGARKIRAKQLVNSLRDVAKEREKLLEKLRKLRERIECNGDFTLGELGISAEELESLAPSPLPV